MCGRYTIANPSAQAIAARFGTEPPDAELLGRVNVAPTESVLAVSAERKAKALRWGITPSWSDRPFINVRSETVATKQPFAQLVRTSAARCLVIADGFYEWMRSESGRGRPIPFRFHLPDEQPFAFAGLWTGQECAILTCPPNAVVERLHNRMPVILGGREEEAAWLAAELRPEDLPAVCCPLPDDQLVCEPADPAINRAGEPVATGQESLF